MPMPIENNKGIFDFGELKNLNVTEQLELIKNRVKPSRDKFIKSDLDGLDIMVKNKLIDMYIEKNPAYIALNANILGLDGDEEKYQLAIKLINKNTNVGYYIDKFDIQDENVRLKLANELIAKNAEMELLINIDKFNIKDQDFLINFANSLILINPEKLIECFKKFDIQSEEKRIYFAEKLSVKNEYIFARHLDDFKIENTDVLLGLARKILTREPAALFSNISKFRITDKNLLLDFAREIVGNNGEILAKYIHKLYLDEKDRIEFAQKIVRKYEGNISPYIKRFDIKDEEIRRQLVKIAVSVNANKMVNHIKNYDIHDKDFLLEIAKKAELNVYGVTSVLNAIEDYKIDKINDLNLLFEMAISHPTMSIYLDRKVQKYIEYLEILHGNIRYISILPEWMIKTIGIFNKNIAEEALLHKKSSVNIKQFLKYIKNKKNGFIKVNFELDILGIKNAEKIENVLNNMKKGRQRDYESACDITEVLLLSNKNMLLETEYKDELTKVMLELISIKKPDLKNKLLPYVVKLLNENSMDKIKKELEYGKGNKKNYPAINAIIFESLGLYKEENKQLLADARKLFTSNKFTKDSKSLQEVMLNLLSLRGSYIEDEHIIIILKNLLKNPSKLKENMKYISSTIYLDETDKLVNYDGDGFKRLFYEIYKEYLGLKNEAFVGRYEAFVNTKENMIRNLEELIMKYIAANNKYDSVMERTKLFVETLGDVDEYRMKKYNLDESEHLRTIKSINPKLYEKWINGQEEFQNTQEGDEKVIVTDDAVDLFLMGSEVDNSCQSVEYGGDFNKCLMGYVMDGKSKIIAIKDKNGKIVARCVIKLVLDGYEKNVILLKEPMYKKNNIPDEEDIKLQEKCIEYAKYLGIDAVMSGGSICARKRDMFTGDLVVKKGPSPFEYEDAMGDYFQSGGYRIKFMPLRYLYRHKGGMIS